jgi:FKBP-type peptidyl-prolyl cis-trans isomerase 2
MADTKKALKTSKTKKGDFVELDFVAKVKNGNVFDTTIEEEAKKAGLFNENNKESFKPFKLCIGKDMILHGLDIQLGDKELRKEYEIELEPEKAFGKRNPKLVKIFSLGVFVKKGMTPEPGAFVNINNMVAKILSVSSGRVVADFNNPLADKTVVYKFKIKSFVEDEKEKVNAVADFYFKDYEIKEKEGKFELFVKGKKIDAVDKSIKEIFPDLEIVYS